MEQWNGNRYEICVKEPINPSWSDWLDGFVITRTEGKETLITGCVKDQTALYGLLDTLRDLNLTLISVRKVG